jgi:exportin-5
VYLRREFLPPVISSLFQRLRFKVDFEWAADNQHTEQATADDDLDDEMKNQSILRTMTFAACNLLWGLVGRRGKQPTPFRKPILTSQNRTRRRSARPSTPSSS